MILMGTVVESWPGSLTGMCRSQDQVWAIRLGYFTHRLTGKPSIGIGWAGLDYSPQWQDLGLEAGQIRLQHPMASTEIGGRRARLSGHYQHVQDLDGSVPDRKTKGTSRLGCGSHCEHKK